MAVEGLKQFLLKIRPLVIHEALRNLKWNMHHKPLKESWIINDKS